MAVHLHTTDTNHTLALKSSPSTEDDFIAELTQQMAHFMLQEDHDSFHSSSNSELSWDLTSSSESTLWSPVSYNQGSSEGSSQEPSPPATPGKFQDSCWKTTTYDHVVNVFDNNNNTMKGEHNHGYEYEIQNSKSSDVNGLSSYKTLIEEQIRAISDIKQEHALFLKQKLVAANGKYESKEEIQKKWDRLRPTRPAPLQTGGMRAVFIGRSGSRNGTGVFLPRAGTVAPSEPTNKQGKGCSTVLIPARVVQALQLHFDKTAAISGPKAVAFPPLRDLVVSDKDGMYSMENLKSTKNTTDVQNDMILPHEWTY